jgi:demethylmenaquinone methyltransferase/2-methoxy-6-polyprenyl-1,4-benzoquinol methylase
MFGRIAQRYDLMNALMTGGLDRVWRRWTVDEAALPAGGLALDVGTGTGDVALALAASADDSRVIGLDYTGPMIALAPAKASHHAAGSRVTWMLGDGHRLPFADRTFDAVTSAFVLRNFVDLPLAFSEMARVTRPGGRVVALEIAPDGAPLWRELFETYFNRVVPVIGRLIAGDTVAYSYLPDSVAGFHDTPAVASIMADSGLQPLPARRLMLGTVVIHRGVRPGG